MLILGILVFHLVIVATRLVITLKGREVKGMTKPNIMKIIMEAFQKRICIQRGSVHSHKLIASDVAMRRKYAAIYYIIHWVLLLLIN